MSGESEDFNEFNSWDCLGAAMMLGITPAILNFVFNDKEIVSTVFLAGIGAAAAVTVFLIAVVTRSRFIGRMVNWVGLVLTIVYIGIAIAQWMKMASDSTPAALPAAEEQTAEKPAS